MGAPPVLPVLAPGNRPGSTYFAALKTYMDFLASPPSACAYRTVAASIADGVETPLGMDEEEWDSEGIHSVAAGGANSKMVIQTDGFYRISAFCRFVSNATGYRRLQVRQNADGNPDAGIFLKVETRQAVSGTGTTVDLHFERYLVTGAELQMFAGQNSGGGLALDVGIRRVGMQVRWVGRG